MVPSDGRYAAVKSVQSKGLVTFNNALRWDFHTFGRRFQKIRLSGFLTGGKLVSTITPVWHECSIMSINSALKILNLIIKHTDYCELNFPGIHQMDYKRNVENVNAPD